MSGKTARKLRKDENEMISTLVHSETFEQNNFKGKIWLIKDTLMSLKKGIHLNTPKTVDWRTYKPNRQPPNANNTT